jgi:toxin YoeB
LNVLWSPQAWEDYLGWQADPEALKRVNALIRECQRTPFKGTGKPEPLRHDMAGCWSRRITQKDRLVYRVRGKGADQVLEIIQCRQHY